MPTFDIPVDFGTEDGYREKYSEQDLFEEFTRNENGEVVLTQQEAEAKIDNLGGYEKLYRIKLEADYLHKLAYEGARVFYGDPLSPEVDERLNFELYIMKTMGFPGYFLIVQDFIAAAQNELGVSVGLRYRRGDRKSHAEVLEFPEKEDIHPGEILQLLCRFSAWHA